MRIFVCVKPVPDTAAKIKVHSDGNRIDPSGVKFELGSYESRTIAKAVDVRNAVAGSELVVISAGNPSAGENEARKRIKDVLALGADRGVLVPDPAPENRDPLATAKALSAAIKAEGEFGLVMLGRQAIDDQALSVGPMLATLLEVPCLTDVVGLETDGTKATIRRAAEGRTETIEATLPLVVTCQRDLAEEKYPKLKEILKAKKKKVTEFAYEWPAPTYEVTQLLAPPEPEPGKIVGEGPDAVPALLDLLQNEAKALSF